jgi:hypothetical protein
MPEANFEQGLKLYKLTTIIAIANARVCLQICAKEVTITVITPGGPGGKQCPAGVSTGTKQVLCTSAADAGNGYNDCYPTRSQSRFVICAHEDCIQRSPIQRIHGAEFQLF